MVKTMKIISCMQLLVIMAFFGGCATSPNPVMTDTRTGSAETAMALTRESNNAAASRYGDSIAVVYFGEKEWVVYTDKGCYDCTPGAERYFHLVCGLEVAPVDEYRVKCHVFGLRGIFMKGR
jgi:hypothetical protein